MGENNEFSHLKRMRKKLEQENLEKRLRERDNPPKSMRKRMENKKIDKQGKEKTNE